EDVKGLDKEQAVRVPPLAGDVWRVNMYRMDVPQGKPQQASGWSPPMVGDFHALDKFGELVFGDEKGVVPPKQAVVAGTPPGLVGTKGPAAGTAGDKKAAASLKGGAPAE